MNQLSPTPKLNQNHLFEVLPLQASSTPHGYRVNLARIKQKKWWVTLQPFPRFSKRYDKNNNTYCRSSTPSEKGMQSRDYRLRRVAAFLSLFFFFFAAVVFSRIARLLSFTREGESSVESVMTPASGAGGARVRPASIIIPGDHRLIIIAIYLVLGYT